MKYVKEMIVGSLVSGLVLISGCASQTETMVQEGYPVAYAQGFEDGCHSGKQAGGSMFDQFKKDVNRFGRDIKYSQGWSDGFRQCEREEEALERQVRMNMEQQNLNEALKHNQDSVASSTLNGINYDAHLLNSLK